MHRFELSPYTLLLKLYLDDSLGKSFHIRILDALLCCLVFYLNHTTHSIDSFSNNSLSHPSPVPHHGDRSPSLLARQNILCGDREKFIFKKLAEADYTAEVLGQHNVYIATLTRQIQKKESVVKVLDSKRAMSKKSTKNTGIPQCDGLRTTYLAIRRLSGRNPRERSSSTLMLCNNIFRPPNVCNSSQCRRKRRSRTHEENYKVRIWDVGPCSSRWIGCTRGHPGARRQAFPRKTPLNKRWSNRKRSSAAPSDGSVVSNRRCRSRGRQSESWLLYSNLEFWRLFRRHGGAFGAGEGIGQCQSTAAADAADGESKCECRR